MIRFLASRLVGGLLVLLLVSLLVFVLIDLIPGDPVRMMLGPLATPQQIATVKARWGLDQPGPIRYFKWLQNIVLHGDFGKSLFYNQKATTLLWRALPVTGELTLLSMLISLSIAIPIGLLSASRAGTRQDRILRTGAILGASIPDFVLSFLMLVVFAVELKIAPARGFVPLSEDVLGNLQHVAMPVVAVGIFFGAIQTRFVRTIGIAVLSEDYIRTARSKGVGELALNIRHVLRNVTIPILSLLGVQIVQLLGGVIIQETIFGLPGVGRLALTSVLNRDYPILQVITLFTAAAAVILNLTVDILYGLVDPRITHD